MNKMIISLIIMLVSCFNKAQQFIPDWCSDMCNYPPIEVRYCFKNNYLLTATVYNAVPMQTDDTPLITASGAKITKGKPYEHRWLAVSRDLLDDYPFGSIVYITGVGKYNGYWKVQDVMNKRYKNSIDLLVNNNVKYGKWEDVAMYCVETPDLYN
jgi:3D (Asp-Asp-Asp) domain-containing protein